MATLNQIRDKPDHPALQDAYKVLKSAWGSSEAFFDSFLTVRKARGAKGTSTDSEQDLLRAGLVFASAGLDSMVKQLIRDTLGEAILVDEGAEDALRKHAAWRLKKETPSGEPKGTTDWLAEVLVSNDPRAFLEADHVDHLTARSLQSKEELLRVAAAFGIQPDEICSDLNRLQKVFVARNHISHEMDIDLSSTNRNRRSRTKASMIRYSNFLFTVAANFLTAVEQKLDG